MSDPVVELQRFKSVQAEPCPDADSLLSYSQMTLEQARSHRDFSHIELCMHCQSLLHALDENRPETIEERRALTVGERKWAGLEAAPRRLQPRRLGLIAAGILILVVAAPLLYRWSSPLPQIDRGIRGSEIQLVSPVGPTTPPLRFQWNSPIAAARFRVEVFDAGGQRVFNSEGTAEYLEPSFPFRPGATYTWSVRALDAAGEVMIGSKTQTFSVR